MNAEQQKSILAITLFAAFADGAKHDREREEVRRIADSLATDADAPDLAQLYQDVLLKRLSLQSAAAALTDAGERQLSYEMAVGVYRLWRDLGYAVGALLAGLTADALGLPAAMWIVAALTSASGVLVAVRMTETLRRSPAPASTST